MDIISFLKMRLRPWQKVLLKKVYNTTLNNKWFCRILSSRVIIVLGCQRSGTTLLYMLITAHSKITGKDESESNYDFPKAINLLVSFWNSKLICYKLPNKTHDLDLIIQRFPSAKVLWIERDPLAFISSMKSLRFNKYNGQNWLEAYGYRVFKRQAILFPEISSY